MAVENPQTPGGKDQKRRTGEENLHEMDGKQALWALKSWSNGANEPWCGEYSGDYQKRRDKKQQREDGFGQLRGFFVAFFSAQAGIDRNERRRKDTFPEEVLQKVGNAESGAKGIRRVGVAEIVSKYPVADQPDNTAEQDTAATASAEARAENFLCEVVSFKTRL